MLKNSFRFLVPGAFGTLAALLLLNGTQVGMILGEASPPQLGWAIPRDEDYDRVGARSGTGNQGSLPWVQRGGSGCGQ